MAQAMASMTALLGSSQAVLENSHQLGGASRCSRVGLARPCFVVRAQQGPVEAETSRRAVLGLVAAGLASGSLVKSVLAEAKPIKIGPPPPPSGGLRKFPA